MSWYFERQIKLWSSFRDEFEALWFLDDNDEEREKLENLKIDFNIVQHLKDLYPKLSMENVYFLYSNNDIDKINWEKVEKCGNLGIFFWECKLFLNDTEVDLNLLEDLKKAWVNFAEQDIISKKWWKRWKIEENKEQILQNLADIKKYLSIQKFNVGYLFDDFLMRKLSLDFDKLQELQEQWRKFECSHLRALNWGNG